MELENLSLKTQKIVAKNIQDYMKLHSVPNKEALAAQCGISKMQLYNILNLKSSPTLDYTDRIADGLGVTFSQLITENYFEQFETKIVKKNK